MHRALFRPSALLAIVPLLLSFLLFSGSTLASVVSAPAQFATFAQDATPVVPESPGVGEEPADQDNGVQQNGESEAEGGLEAAATADQLTLSQLNPFRGEQIFVVASFNQVATDEGAIGLTVDFPEGTSYNGDVSLMCSVACGSYQSSLTGVPPNSLFINYNAGNLGGVTQTISVSFSVTVAADAAYGAALPFSAIGDSGSRIFANAEVATPLVADNASYDVAYEHSLNGTVTSTGGVGDVFYEQASVPSRGTVSVSFDGSFTYTAGAGQTGEDTFQFTAYDSRNPQQRQTGEITITISDPVTANDTSITVDFEGSGTGAVTASGGIGTLTFAVLDNPTKGTVVVNPDGTFEYTANANVTGVDQFTVTASDTSSPPLTDVATVSVTIGAPPALVAEPLTLTVNAGETVTGDLSSQVSGGILPYTFALTSQAVQGEATVSPDGAFTYVAGIDASGTDTFTYSVTDSNETTQVTGAATTTGTVNVEIVAAPTATATATLAPGVTPSATTQPTATATTMATATATATDEARPVIPGRTPTATSFPNNQGGPNGNGGNGSGPVSRLPSTGQGNDGTSVPTLLILSLAALSLLCLSLGARKRTR